MDTGIQEYGTLSSNFMGTLQFQKSAQLFNIENAKAKQKND